jgi:hypothetical protein
MAFSVVVEGGGPVAASPSPRYRACIVPRAPRSPAVDRLGVAQPNLCLPAFGPPPWARPLARPLGLAPLGLPPNHLLLASPSQSRVSALDFASFLNFLQGIKCIQVLENGIRKKIIENI